MNAEEDHDDDLGELREDAKYTLSTPLGRFIERAKYWQVALAAAALIVGVAGYFYVTRGTCNGLTSSSPLRNDFWEALYFSIVTFTTVGYGDLTPTGFGRLVVSFEVLAGLLLTAVLIGKVASERQSALLLLVYTSEQQKRIAGFAQEVQAFTDVVSRYGLVDEKRAAAFALLLRSMRAYLIFQSHQGRLADFGNGSALRNLYRSMRGLLKTLEHTFKTQPLEAEVEEVLLKCVQRLTRLARVMATFHRGDRSTLGPLIGVDDWARKIEAWESTAVTWRRMKQVAATVPRKPWPKHFHKAAAAELGISQNLYRRCMDRLLAQGQV